MFGDTIYTLPLAPGYVSHWGLAHAVRELIQNALDSPAPFAYEFDKEADGEISLTLTSEGVTLPPSTLLLGATSKAEDDSAIGSFGEGYKIAMLVLTRLGKKLEIRNGNVIWQPEFKFDKRFDGNLLTVRETTNPQKSNSLSFILHGLSPDEIQEIRDCCLLMQDNIGERKLTTKGDILLDRPGKLYVGNLFVCTTELRFGYNIKPQFLKLERDRQTVSSWDLKGVTTEMWYDTKQFDLIAEYIEQDLPDVYYARWGAPELVKEACYMLFRKNNPGAVVAETQEDLRRMVKQGMERVVVLSGGMYGAVSTSKSYRSEPAIKPLASPVDRMQDYLNRWHRNMHVDAVRAFKQLIDEGKGWKLR